MMTNLYQTQRLIIRRFTLEDACFIVQLLNQDSFIRYIADKNVHTLDDATQYLNQGPLKSYAQHGFGLNLVALKESNQPIGMCGLIKRPELDCPDIGYALLDDYCGQGYGFEAANVVLGQGMKEHQIDTVQAITLPDNAASNGLLIKLEFKLIDQIALYDSLNNLYQIQKVP